MIADYERLLDEISERLGISRQTIFYWVKDVPLKKPRRASAGQRRGNEAMRLKYKRLRDEAYEEGWAAFDELVCEPTFRDFVWMYIGEGFKRTRNAVQIYNSDPKVLILAEHWMRRFARNKISYSIQYHADQDPDDLTRFWGRMLRIDASDIRLQRKSNSNQLNGRNWRSRWGVLTISTGDTYFRAKLQAWMDRIREEWLDSAA